MADPPGVLGLDAESGGARHCVARLQSSPRKGTPATVRCLEASSQGISHDADCASLARVRGFNRDAVGGEDYEPGD